MFRLPEEVMWFEPPTVCRWETAEETKISELLEKKRNLHSAKKKRAAHKRQPPKVIKDFDLLNMPSGLDLYCLMQEFVVPRLPNGYMVKMGKITVEPAKPSKWKNLGIGKSKYICRIISVVFFKN